MLYYKIIDGDQTSNLVMPGHKGCSFKSASPIFGQNLMFSKLFFSRSSLYEVLYIC